MSSRADILTAIRRQVIEPAALPSLEHAWIRYDDPLRQFSETLAFVGGTAHVVSAGDLARTVAELPPIATAREIVSLVPGVSLGNVELSAIDDPHRLESIDVAIVPGTLAVAENGAVWVDHALLKHRAVLFLTQHLVLVVPRARLCHHLHEAYARLSFEQRGYGLFISGPSKTADIEQSLVIGAHGPRSLHVVLVEE